MSALCVRSQGIDWEALDKLKAENTSFDVNQPESHYIATDPISAPGYSSFIPLHLGAIQAPKCSSADTYLGVRIFRGLNTTLCTEACNGVSACQFINTSTATRVNSVPATTTTTATTVWETTTTTLSSAATLMPSDGDFELGQEQNNWKFDNPNCVLKIYKVPDNNGDTTWAFKAGGPGSDTYAYLTTIQSYTLEAGITYRISLSVNGDVVGAQNTAVQTELLLLGEDGSSVIASWTSLRHGVALGNSWYRFSNTIALTKQRDCFISTRFLPSGQQGQVQFVDDYVPEEVYAS